MGKVVLTYDLADGRRLELDAGPFYTHGKQVYNVWWLLDANGHNLCTLEYEEVIYESCGGNAQRATSDSAMSGKPTATETSNSHADD